VAYSIASGLASARINRLIISTDDPEIARVASEYGAEVPFLRPAELAQDDTPDYPVIRHALEHLAAAEGYHPAALVQLRPTSPFRTRGLIDRAVDLLEEDQEADCVRGVTVPKQVPYKMWRPTAGGYLAPLLDVPGVDEPYNAPRQNLPQAFWQTGHVDAVRTVTILEKGTLTGRRVRPILVEPQYCVDIDTEADFELAEEALAKKSLDIDLPSRPGEGRRPRDWPETIDLLVFDFDGVFTDNRVLVLQDGTEGVLCDRSDGLGLASLRRRDLPMAVLSTETNPVVKARCTKLGLPSVQGLGDKRAALVELAASRGIDLSRTVYVGNDENDVGCMQAAGFAVAVADSHPSAVRVADLVLASRGGRGALRELCDSILVRLTGDDS
jgi:YrbI family 3-deoxy-D-manno-octulosonate 8-phosphate phosphatase